MTRRRVVAVATGLMAVVTLGTPGTVAHAQLGVGGGLGSGRPGFSMPGDPLRGRGDMLWRRGLPAALQLTAAQREKLEAIRDRHLRFAIRQRADLAEAALDLRRLVRADRPDRHAIDAQIERIGGLRIGLEKARIAALLEAREVLTPDQRRRWHELLPQTGPMRRRGGASFDDGDEGPGGG